MKIHLLLASIMLVLALVACGDDSPTTVGGGELHACASYNIGTEVMANCVSSPDTTMTQEGCEAENENTQAYSVRALASCPTGAKVQCQGTVEGKTANLYFYTAADSVAGEFMCALLQLAGQQQ